MGSKVLCDLAVTMQEVPRKRTQAKPARFPSKIKVLLGKLGPIIAMTITLAVVYTPIAFQGGLTGCSWNLQGIVVCPPSARSSCC